MDVSKQPPNLNFVLELNGQVFWNFDPKQKQYAGFTCIKPYIEINSIYIIINKKECT